MSIILHNGRIETDLKLTSENKVYEVIRVISKKPLFLKEHYERLINSLSIKNSDAKITYETFRERIDDLIVMLAKDDFNIKVVIDLSNNNDYFFENPSSYPSQDLYKNGIDTVSLKYQRLDPNAKVINPNLNITAKELTEKENVYEAILVDYNDNITEGSKSNIFFTHNDILYTPETDKVLPGITREKIIETAKNAGFTVRQINIPLQDAKKYSGAFISGTSPKILPIRRIDDVTFDINEPLIRNLMNLFDETIQKDLDSYNL